MCGRYSFTKVDEFGDRFGLEYVPKEVRENYNVAPTQTMPVIVSENGKNKVELMRWGIPRFIGPGKVKDVFNTRSDKAFSSWKKLTLTKRLLVPATGFYEWKATADGKQPFYIFPKSEDMFAFAGIWNLWKDDDGKEVEVYSIMTTEPNKEMSGIHNRMPVILHKEDEASWLSHDIDEDQESIDKLLKPLEDNGLKMYEVSKDVNTVKINNKQLLYPINSK